MKVTLIIPPSPFLLDERVFPSLGILKVASSLKKCGHDVNVVDLSGNSNYLNDVEVSVKNNNPDIVGITSTTPQFPYTINVSKVLRNKFPSLKQILGGAHSTLVHSSMKKKQPRAEKNWKSITDNFDIVVCGDGENAIHLALTPDSLSVIDADNASSPLFLTNKSFDETSFPARELIDLNTYHYYMNGKRTTSIVGQLGCPFACGFCSGRNSPMLRKIRLRTAESIADEIMNIHSAYGYEGFMFYDDELNLSQSMITLMKKLIEFRNKGYDFKYRGCIKSQLLTDEQAMYMADAGFSEVLVGFESGNDRILTNINKKATKQDNERCIELLRKYKIKPKFLMSIGHPGESDETCQDTHDWLLTMNPEYFDVTIITTHPGSFYYDNAVLTTNGWKYTCPNGDSLYSADLDYSMTADFYKGMPGDYKSYVYTDYLTSNELVKWRDYMESSIRSKCNIPYPTKVELSYDKTMGQ